MVPVTILLMIVALPTFMQNQYGHYSTGTSGSPKMALLLSTGFVVENETFVFTPRQFVDGSGNSTSYDNNVMKIRRDLLYQNKKQDGFFKWLQKGMGL